MLMVKNGKLKNAWKWLSFQWLQYVNNFIVSVLDFMLALIYWWIITVWLHWHVLRWSSQNIVDLTRFCYFYNELVRAAYRFTPVPLSFYFFCITRSSKFSICTYNHNLILVKFWNIFFLLVPQVFHDVSTKYKPFFTSCECLRPTLPWSICHAAGAVASGTKWANT